MESTPDTHYFDSGSRLSQDMCAQSTRAAGNASIFDYLVASFRPACDKPQTHIGFALRHPNLRPVDGYGAPPPCEIDGDSDFRNNPERGVEWAERRQPLSTRVFHAAPSLGRGESLPTLEHVLVAGQSSAPCGPTPGTLAEVESDMQPMLPAVQQLLRTGADATDAWSLQFGEPSRDALRKMRTGIPHKA